MGDAKPFIDYTLSIGDLMQAGAIVVAIAGAYFGMRGQVDILRVELGYHAKAVTDSSARLEAVVRDVGSLRTEVVAVVRDVENLTARTENLTERIDSITERRRH